MTTFRVIRYGIDRLRVLENGKKVLDVSMGPNGPLNPVTAEEAKSRPWFYTGSPYGKEIMDLAWQRGALSSYKIQLLTHEEASVKHEFWEDSPTRIAMRAASEIINQIPLDPNRKWPPAGRTRKLVNKPDTWEVEVKPGVWVETKEMARPGPYRYFFIGAEQLGDKSLSVVFLERLPADEFIRLWSKSG